MNHQLSFIASKLSEKPFNKALTPIRLYDDLDIASLIGLVSDVLVTLTPKQEQVTKETIDQSTLRVATFFNILEYEPASDVYLILTKSRIYDPIDSKTSHIRCFIFSIE